MANKLIYTFSNKILYIIDIKLYFAILYDDDDSVKKNCLFYNLIYYFIK